MPRSLIELRARFVLAGVMRLHRVSGAAGRLAVESSVVDELRRLVLTRAYRRCFCGFVHAFPRLSSLRGTGGRISGGPDDEVERVMLQVLRRALRRKEEVDPRVGG